MHRMYWRVRFQFDAISHIVKQSFNEVQCGYPCSCLLIIFLLIIVMDKSYISFSHHIFEKYGMQNNHVKLFKKKKKEMRSQIQVIWWKWRGWISGILVLCFGGYRLEGNVCFFLKYIIYGCWIMKRWCSWNKPSSVRINSSVF